MTLVASEIRVQSISLVEFERWPSCQKAIVHDHARRFCAISMSGKWEFSLSWRSDAVDPILTSGSQSETWLGADQRVACVSGDGRILLSLGLASSVLRIHCLKNCSVILCETEVLIINLDFSIREIRGLADLPTEIMEQEDALVITFNDGHGETIP